MTCIEIVRMTDTFTRTHYIHVTCVLKRG